MAVLGSALVLACGSGRDDPKGSAGISTVGSGGSTATTSSTGGSTPSFACGDPEVTCDSEVRFGDCTMFTDRRTLWEFLHYKTTVFGDARIEFAVRTAETEDELSSASFELASVADVETQTVPPFDPIHLDEVLDPGDEFQPWLELRMKRINGLIDGSTPSVEEWDLQFSCVEF